MGNVCIVIVCKYIYIYIYVFLDLDWFRQEQSCLGRKTDSIRLIWLLYMGMHHEKPLFFHVILLGSMPGTLLPHSLSPTLYKDCSQTCHLHMEYAGLRRCQRFKLCWIRVGGTFGQNKRWMQCAERLRKNFLPPCVQFPWTPWLQPTKDGIACCTGWVLVGFPSTFRSKPSLLSHTFTSPFDWSCVILAQRSKKRRRYTRK